MVIVVVRLGQTGDGTHEVEAGELFGRHCVLGRRQRPTGGGRWWEVIGASFPLVVVGHDVNVGCR